MTKKKSELKGFIKHNIEDIRPPTFRWGNKRQELEETCLK
jgi:hypothetical protein